MSERDGIKCMKCARVDCSGDCRQQESEGVECYCTEDYKCHHHFRPENEDVVVEIFDTPTLHASGDWTVEITSDVICGPGTYHLTRIHECEQPAYDSANIEGEE